MKKAIVFLFGIMVVVLSFTFKENQLIIPKENIRFRIIANSNTLADQRLKLKVNSVILPEIQNLMNNSSSIEASRENIAKAIPMLSQEISKYTTDFNISFGANYFPEKELKGITYSAGEYESLVITLGQGSGDNWWCVMFPPLCLLEAKESDLDDVTYTSYIKTIINKYL